MTNEVFAWTAASNNQAMVAGRLSMAMNAISITRTRRERRTRRSRGTIVARADPGRAERAARARARDGLLRDLEVRARTRRWRRKFLIDLAVKYTGAFENSRFYNFPSFPNSVPEHPGAAAPRSENQPRGKYTILDEINKKYTKNVGYPGFSNPAIDEVFNKFLIPQMFAEVAQDKRTPADAARTYDRQLREIFQKWRNRGKI